MIFQPELARAVKAGKKTQTRRVVVEGKPCAYRVGQDYPVQPAIPLGQPGAGRGGKAICRVIVIDRREQRLGDLTYQDAIAEGFRTRADFARYWIRLHDMRSHRPGLSADEVLEAWLRRHGEVRVWAITFQLPRPLKVVVPDVPVYLTGPRSTAGGTTTDPRLKWPGEPAAFGHAGSVTRAIVRAKQEHRDQLQLVHQLCERARTAYEQAIAGDVDVEADVAVLERQVRELEAKLRAA